MIEQMKGTDLDTGVQGEHFVIYMHMTGSDDSGTDIPEAGSITDTESESEAFHWINCIVWNGQLF